MNQWFKDTKNQEKLALIVGYILVAVLAFGLGRISKFPKANHNLEVLELGNSSNFNSNPNIQGAQTINSNSSEVLTPVDGQCGGKIKGNIGSSGKIYHVPGGAFYDRTDAEECFATEADAVTAGFRRSSR